MLFALTFLIGAVAIWIWLLIQAKQGKALLKPEPWKPRVWGFVDILTAAFIGSLLPTSKCRLRSQFRLGADKRRMQSK